MLPFTTEQFLSVFESYNRSVWPAQFVLFATALVLIVLAIWNRRISDKVIGVGLAILWLWMGIAYQWLHFSAFNPAAYLFGGAMILQALLFLHATLVRSRLWFQARWNAYGIAGGVLLVYALTVYPLLGFLFGHSYPRSPTFGVPCPTTIFTFGMLLWTERPVPKYLLIIPFLWMLIGSSAAWLLGVWQDLGLLAAGFIAGTMILYRDRPQNKGKAA